MKTRMNLNRALRFSIVMVAAIATIYFLYRIREVLVIFAFAAFLAYILFRPVIWLESKGLKRAWAILLLYLLVLSLAGCIFSLVLPGLISEIGDLAAIVPQYTSEVQDLAEKLQDTAMPGELSQILKENINGMEGRLYKILKNFVSGLYGLLSTVFILIFSPILAFYIINDWEKIESGFLKLFSPGGRREVLWLIEQIDLILINFFKGYLLAAIFVGVMVGISAMILGLKFPLFLGLITGLTNIIPYFGALIGGTIVVVVGLSESARLGIYAGIAILLIQQTESNFITPRVIGGRLGMHPLAIVFAFLAGGELFGIWGMLLAVPFAAILKLLVSWVYLKVVRA